MPETTILPLLVIFCPYFLAHLLSLGEGIDVF